MFSKPICEKPVIIVHPNVSHYVERAVIKVINNKQVFMYHNESDVVFNGRFFQWLNSNYPKPKDVDDVNKYYLVDSNGEIMPVYLEVPCGCCDVCRMRKINSVVQQCEFEMLEDYPLCDNFFVTLTYRQLPWCSSFLGGLCLRHIQAYIKRIRTWISKNVGKEESKAIKVIYSGEYGSRTKRPHYHIAFFHFPIHKIKYPIYHAIKIFEYLWSKPKFGFMENFVPFSDYKVSPYGHLSKEAQLHYDTFNYGFVNVKRVRSKNAGKYIGKYISKGGNTLNTAKTFFRKSINLGMNYFNKYIKSQCLYWKSNKFTYKNLSNEIKEDSHLCSYYLNKLYPSLSRMVPSEVRKAMYYMRNILQKLRKNIKLPNLPYSIDEYDNRYVRNFRYFDDTKLRSIYKKCYAYVFSFFGTDYVQHIQELILYDNERSFFYSNSQKQSIFDEVFRLKWSYNEIKLQVKL